MPWRMPNEIWQAVLSYDLAALRRPWRNSQFVAAFATRNLTAAATVARRGRGSPHKAMLVEQLLAHGHAERCARFNTSAAYQLQRPSAAELVAARHVRANRTMSALSAGMRRRQAREQKKLQEIRRKALIIKPSSRRADSCQNTTRLFDNAELPFRWLPGLPVVRMADGALRKCGEPGHRLEVMHVKDYAPGPLWLYSSPGSGVWWDPGRCVATRNLVSAILLWRPITDVADALRRRQSNPSYPQWSAAFGHERWEEVLAGARDGDSRYAKFAMAGPLIADLLSPHGVDSIVLLDQMHVWPRESEYSFAPEAVEPCGDPPVTKRERWGVASRLWAVPEIVDLRAAIVAPRPKSSFHQRLMRQAARHISSDAEGIKPCSFNVESSCLSCSPETAALCTCAFAIALPVARIPGAEPVQVDRTVRRGSLTNPKYNGAAARECWLRTWPGCATRITPD
jgi:hypothetical protein